MSRFKVATAAYPLGVFDQWDDYAAKIREWVAEAAGQGADLLLFPEYGALELATLDGTEVSSNAAACLQATSNYVPRSNEVHSALAQEFGVTIVGGSAPVLENGVMVNRAPIFGPEGTISYQDKQIMTRFERDPWAIEGGEPLQIFDTPVGKLGILTCYDSEFPLLGRALVEAGAEVILVPSCTEGLEGYWRVRIGAMSRALEGQCVTVMASLVGDRPEISGMETNTGMGGVFGPPDEGFPPTGVIAEGTLGQPGWTYGEIDLGKVRAVRADGHVLNASHWGEQVGRDGKPDHILVK